jgi:GMP synthase-like glutamine amidotransferase
MTNRWVVLQHVEWESSGMIGREARMRGLEVDVRRLDRGDDVPDSDCADGLIVMGGPIGAYEEENYPFLADESKLLGEVARSGRPVLGVCLGAQLLAKALGANVFPGHEPEIGFGSVVLDSAAKFDPVLAAAGDSLPVFHWHGDTFTLPEGAILLASSQKYSQQAFRFGNHAYGFQFHIEPDAATWSTWQEHLPEGLLNESEDRRGRIEQVGKTIIARFFDHALRWSATSERTHSN